MILVDALLEAVNTFPKETGLGWDRLHPRTLNRLSHGLLLWICAVLHQAEITGKWPEAAELVLIALLPKSDGVQSHRIILILTETVDEDKKECCGRAGGIHAKAVPICGQEDGLDSGGVETRFSCRARS